jgi:hypothetical protein
MCARRTGDLLVGRLGDGHAFGLPGLMERLRRFGLPGLMERLRRNTDSAGSC